MILSIAIFTFCSKNENNEEKNNLTKLTKSKSEFIINTLFNDDVFSSDALLGLDYGIEATFLFNTFLPDSNSNLNKNVSNDTVFIVNYSNNSDTTKIYYLKNLKKFYILFTGNDNESPINKSYRYFSSVVLYDNNDKALSYLQLIANIPISKYEFDGTIDMISSSTKENIEANTNSNFNYIIETPAKDKYIINGSSDVLFNYNKEEFKLKSVVQDFTISEAQNYPIGIYKIEGDNSTYIKIVFNGTELADVEIYDGDENTYKMKLNLETDKLIEENN